MDPRYTGEVLKHLEKQNELLTEVHKSMSHELHKLQVEEEMLMRKFYELMAAQGLTKKKEDGGNAADDHKPGHSTALPFTRPKCWRTILVARGATSPPRSGSVNA